MPPEKGDPDSDRPFKQDSRYRQVLTDPRFKRLPRSQRKLKVDRRFKSLFKKDFQLTTGVDPRGKKKLTQDEDLKKFYDIESIPDNSSGGSADDDVSASEQADSSTDGEQEVAEYTEETPDWIDLDKDVERSQEVSSRLAVCNMDWDRISAQDIYLAIYSILPAGTGLKSVKVYLSDFGKERLAKEAVSGPDIAKCDEESDDGEDLRRYQLDRLKYYYAIAEFDDVSAAEKFYQEAESLEFESSGNHFDLRFVPDSMGFDDANLKEMCDRPTEAEDYKPNLYRTSAVAQTRVQCTWDETPQDRLALIYAANKPELDINVLNEVAPLVVNDDEEEEDAAAFEQGEADESRLLGFLKEVREKAPKDDSDDSTVVEVCWDDERVDAEPNEAIPIVQKVEPPRKTKISRRQKRKLLIKAKQEQKRRKDDFAFNDDDPRFKAVYNESTLFNIDPNDRLYKDTPAMKQLVTKIIERRGLQLD